MKKLLFSLFIVAILSGFVIQDIEVYPFHKNESFARGETIQFKMTYGFFTVGKGSVKIHPNYFTMNERPCFKVDISGKTVGMVDWVADVNEQWGAYIDTSALVPHQFYL